MVSGWKAMGGSHSPGLIQLLLLPNVQPASKVSGADHCGSSLKKANELLDSNLIMLEMAAAHLDWNQHILCIFICFSCL